MSGCSKYSEDEILESVEGLSFDDLYSNPPWNVAWSAFDESIDMDERRICVEMLEGVIIGVALNYYEFVPDDDRPTEGEKLAWIWYLRPDFREKIAPLASEDMKEMMKCYDEGTIYDWIQGYGNK